MPTPAESIHDQAFSRFVAAMGEINATTQPTVYWYTPLVLDVEELDPRNLRSTDDVVYQVLDGDERDTEQTTGDVNAEQDVWLLVAKKFKPSPFKPWSPYTTYSPSNPSPRTIRNRLVRDVQMKILADVSLGQSFIDNTEIRNVDRGLRWEQQELWVAAELHIVISVNYRFAAP